MVRALALSLVSLLLAGAVSAQPVDADGAQRRILEQIDETMQDHPVADGPKILLGRALELEGEARQTFDVIAGRTYVATAACDDDCDLELAAETDAGDILDHDEDSRATPLLHFRADRTGRIAIVVTMADCDDAACDYGLGFFALKQPDLQPRN